MTARSPSASKSSSKSVLTLKQFADICQSIADEASYKQKSAIVHQTATELLNDLDEHALSLFLRLLIPGACDHRVYHLNTKQLAKIFSDLLRLPIKQLLESAEQTGDISLSVESLTHSPRSRSGPDLSLAQVDRYLSELDGLTTESDQLDVLEKLSHHIKSRDEWRTFIRLVRKDLRINAGTKIILDGFQGAYEAFRLSRNIEDVARKIYSSVVISNEDGSSDDGGDDGCTGGRLSKRMRVSKKMSARIQLMTPFAPMLAEPCKSVEHAFQKIPSGDIYAETKYDGERIQLHMQDNEFMFYSRSLKPAQKHKTDPLKPHVIRSFRAANGNLILDCEVVVYDWDTDQPLPFGSLGRRKMEERKSDKSSGKATVALYVFDCLYLDDKDLLTTPFAERRRILEDVMNPLKGYIMLSELFKVRDRRHLTNLIDDAIEKGLEGLVVKSGDGVYEPGRRHWLKVKKDYLADGSMADSADLVVLGAYFGSGSKGGMRSVFLMGCYDPSASQWVTVTKAGNGLNDDELNDLQSDTGRKGIAMRKISRDHVRVPDWLSVNRAHTPDFVVVDPTDSQVWEITGAEFTSTDSHTADGISIRFPRITRRRWDKSWKEATDLNYLKLLAVKSLRNVNKLSPLKLKVDTGDGFATKSDLNLSKLSDCLVGKQFFIDESVASNKDILKRQIVAFGGDLTDENTDSNTTTITARKRPHSRDMTVEEFNRKYSER